MASHQAEQLKEKGNAAFRNGEYLEAEDFYTQAVAKYSKNPLLFTNRANARLKLQRWDGAVNDCLKSIEVTGPNGQNHKAFYFLGKETSIGSTCCINVRCLLGSMLIDHVYQHKHNSLSIIHTKRCHQR